MHPNPVFSWRDDEAIRDFMRDNSFARLFAVTPVGPRIAHVPVLVGPSNTLRFHLAASNDLTQHLDGQSALLLVEGPNAYLSANWYGDGRANVPSWNYLAVEAEGTAHQLDRTALTSIVDELAQHLEPKVGEAWTRAKMDADRFEAMLGGIRGFELRVSALRGTRKLSQNRPVDEAQRIIAAMDRVGNHEMAAAMRAVWSDAS